MRELFEIVAEVEDVRDTEIDFVEVTLELCVLDTEIDFVEVTLEV
jgi:hypothetical protein